MDGDMGCGRGPGQSSEFGGGGLGQSSEYLSEVTVAAINQLEDDYTKKKAALLLELDDDDMSIKSGHSSTGKSTNFASNAAVANLVRPSGSSNSGRTRDKFLSSNVHDMLVSGYGSTQGSHQGQSPTTSFLSNQQTSVDVFQRFNEGSFICPLY